jgi:hypothetical protein
MPGLAKLQFPKAIRFTHAEPSYRTEYDRIFGVPLFFDSQMNALLVDEAILNLKLPRTNPYLSEILSGRAEELLKSLESSKTIRGRVENLLVPVLHTGESDRRNDREQIRSQPPDTFSQAESGGLNVRTSFG